MLHLVRPVLKQLHHEAPVWAEELHGVEAGAGTHRSTEQRGRLSTQKISAEASHSYDLVAAQRLKRPLSPHLSIYRPQITWYASTLNRIAGSILSPPPPPAPFAFHSWNGVRHLVWDLGWQMRHVQVMRTGWAVVGLSLVSSVLLAAM
ncbi:MAG: hypothetical protein M1826_002415 [Phylliscum demangeonii]|nr:MAG: hypothetical protein M1826_002415 [Phylliscum demangeonii]